MRLRTGSQPHRHRGIDHGDSRSYHRGSFFSEANAMEFGASIFFTDYSITPAELAVALEERGFDSLWVAEHSHIPVPRRPPPPGGGDLPKRYYDVMDPFVTLGA